MLIQCYYCSSYRVITPVWEQLNVKSSCVFQLISDLVLQTRSFGSEIHSTEKLDTPSFLTLSFAVEAEMTADVGPLPCFITAYRLTFYKYRGTQSKLIKCDWIWNGSKCGSQVFLRGIACLHSSFWKGTLLISSPVVIEPNRQWCRCNISAPKQDVCLLEV